MSELETAIGLEEAAAYLGMAASTLRKRAAAGRAPGRKNGGRWYFGVEQLRRYLDQFRNDAPKSEAVLKEIGALKHVYVIPCGELLVKIGVATDVSERWRALATANPLIGAVLYVSRALKCAGNVERQIHADLREYRMRGEWFQCGHQMAVEAVRRREAEAT